MLQRGVMQRGVLQRGVMQRGVLQRGVLQRGVLQRGVLARVVLATLLGTLLGTLPCPDAQAVLIPSKGRRDSVCLHEQRDAVPLHFDRGELAELLLLSRAVHLTRHGVRFITYGERLLEPETVLGSSSLDSLWYALPCLLQSDRHGALCAIPLSGPHQDTKHSSYVLPCAGDFVPRISYGDGGVSNLSSVAPSSNTPSSSTVSVGDFILQHVPADLRACSGASMLGDRPGEETGIRRAVVPGSHDAGAYDLTQCDFLHSRLTAVYSIERKTVYLRQGVELSDYPYAAVGILITLLVAATAQGFVRVPPQVGQQQSSAPAQQSSAPAQQSSAPAAEGADAEKAGAGEITAREASAGQASSMLAGLYGRVGLTPETGNMALVTTLCLVSLWLGGAAEVVFHPSSMSFLVTERDAVCFLYLVLYIVVRIVAGALSRLVQGTGKRVSYFNLMEATLMLLITRVYMTANTPYTLPIATIMGTRLVSRLRCDAARAQEGLLLERLLLIITRLLDAFLVQVVLWAGVEPQWDTAPLALSCNLSVLFACIAAAIFGKLLA
jgi:hypothetical protein